jgi:hypothetical protein
MKRALISGATVLLGIVPASLALLSNALFLLSVSAGPPEGVKVVVSWLGLALWLLVAVAAVAGYIALFFAARLKVSRRVVGDLLLGVAAVAYELLSTPHEAAILVVLLLPAIVAIAHVISYLARGEPMRSLQSDSHRITNPCTRRAKTHAREGRRWALKVA